MIVFAHHREVLDTLEKQLRDLNIRVGRIDGQVKSAERNEIVRGFQAGEIEVFLGSTHAAGEAITLTRAETVIFVELDWVPGVLLQAEDRGHRAGQEASSYHILHLVAEIVSPPEPVIPKRLKPLVALAEVLPEDYRRCEEAGVSSPALKPAIAQNERGYVRWMQYEHEVDDANWLGGVENLDEHMINALASKAEHIDDVLGETSGPVVGDGGNDTGLQSLIKATEKRVLNRREPKNSSAKSKW